MPESLYGAHPKKLPVRFKLPSHLDLLRFQHAKVKVGSAVHLDITRFLMIIFSEKYLVIPNENIIFAPNLGI